jgi:hypothetical protein
VLHCSELHCAALRCNVRLHWSAYRLFLAGLKTEVVHFPVLCHVLQPTGLAATQCTTLLARKAEVTSGNVAVRSGKTVVMMTRSGKDWQDGGKSAVRLCVPACRVHVCVCACVFVRARFGQHAHA